MAHGPQHVALCRSENIPYPNSAKYYPQMLEWFGPRITGILNTIAATDGAVVINCSAGRDRTGLISYLVMLLGGANDEEMLGLHAASCAGINAWHMVSGIPHPFEYGRDGEDYLGWITDHIDQLQRFLSWYRSTDYQQTLLAAGLREESLAKLLPR